MNFHTIVVGFFIPCMDETGGKSETASCNLISALF